MRKMGKKKLSDVMEKLVRGAENLTELYLRAIKSLNGNGDELSERVTEIFVEYSKRIKSVKDKDPCRIQASVLKSYIELQNDLSKIESKIENRTRGVKSSLIGLPRKWEYWKKCLREANEEYRLLVVDSAEAISSYRPEEPEVV